MKLVLVEWIDDRGITQNWTDKDWLEVKTVSLVHSVGYLLQNTRELVQILPHFCPDLEQGCGDMTIPKWQVKKIVYLKQQPRVPVKLLA